MSGVRGGMVHPFTGALYTCQEDGTILVELDGARGRFRRDGQWIEGEIREADPQLCGWIFGDHAGQGGGRLIDP